MPKLLMAIAVLLILALPGPGWADCGREPSLSRGQHQALARAYKLLEKGHRAGALKQLPPLAETSHHRLAFMRGLLLHGLGRKTAAEKAFARSLKAWPCFAPAWRNLAVTRHELGRNLAAARTAAQGHTRVRPPDQVLAYLAGIFFLQAKQPAQALPWLEGLAAQAKPQASWLLALVQTHLELKRPAKARPVVHRLIRMHPGRASYWRLAASVEMELKNYGPAAAALETAVRLSAPRKGELRQLADLFQAAGVPKKAALYYQRSFGPQPSAKQMSLLARVYLQGNYLAQAADAAKRAVAKKPSPKALILWAQISLRQRKYLEARKAFTRAAERSQGARAARAHLMAGHCALKLDQADLALKSFGLAQKTAPRDNPLAKEAARALKMTRDYLKARQE